VTFFPQLIAGPIVHHHDVIGQFQAMTGRLRSVDLSVGGTIFVFGLFKKVVIADSLAPTADALFTAAAQPGTVLTFGESWMGILAYSGQLYFDFSGYSDMAIGLARMFGVRMPMNFNSPYQARDIIEFWRRWHMTLSRFLRDYLYIPLGGNRHGEARRYLNLFLTFLIGGFWHGASWNFVVWGALHGLYTCVCHGWKAIRIKLGWTTPGRLAGALGMILTFLAVIVSWVFFRADGFATAGKILASMSGLNGFTPSLGLARWMTNLLGIETGSSTYYGSTEVLLVAGAMLMAWFAPNTMRIMRAAEPSLDNREVAPSRLRWVMNRRWAVITALLALIALQSMTRISHFLYFQF
jgi:D-alanyl-lipoteichoic acid acyltransferase DltB (MBOAT superfamily)